MSDDVTDSTHRSAWLRENRFAADSSTASLLAPFEVSLISGFSRRHDDKHLPEVVPVLEAWESPLFDTSAKAVESSQGDVFFVGCAAGGVGQLPSGQPDQS
jgi:hypothetical protein